MTTHLNVALTQVRHPASLVASEAAKTQQVAAQVARPVTVEELTAEHWFERGFDTTDVKMKLFCYGEAIRLRPDFVEAYINRGTARRDKGDLDGALADLTEAIRLEPGFAAAYTNRGTARRQKGDMDGALADLTEAIRLEPDDANAYFVRGYAHLDQGNLSAAIADFERYLDLGGGVRNGNQAQIEHAIQELRHIL